MSNENEKSNAVEKQKNAVTSRISGKDNLPAGFDDVDNQTDLKMPRLAILQALSKLCTEGKAHMGQLANSLTKEVLGEKIDFIPLFMFKTRAQFEIGRGLVMMSKDNIKVTMGLDEFAQYIDKPVEEVPGVNWEGDQPPVFQLVYNFPVLLIDKINEFPISLSLMKTAAKAAQSLLSMARYSGEDIFARVYTLSIKVENNDKGTYAVPVIEFKRRASDEEYELSKKWFDNLYRRKENIAVDLTEETAAEPAA